MMRISIEVDKIREIFHEILSVEVDIDLQVDVIINKSKYKKLS